MNHKNRVAELESDPTAATNGSGGAPPTPVRGKNALNVLWRRRWWIVLSTVCALGAAWLYLSKQVPIYSSSSRLYVQQFTPFNARSAGDGLSAQASTAYISTQCELITSSPLLDAVVALPEIQQTQMMQSTDNPVGLIRSGLSITPDREFITIGFESRYPVEAAQLVNAIAQQYVDYIGKERHNTAAEVLKILAGERDKRERELDSKLKETLDFKRHHGVLSFQDEKGNIVLQQLGKLSDMYTTAHLEAMDAEANFQSVMAMKDDPKRLLDLARAEQPKDTNINIDPGQQVRDPVDEHLAATGDSLRSELEIAERQLARLKRTRTPMHRDVQDAEADLSLIRDQIARNERQIAERKEKLLEQQRRSASEQQTIQVQGELARQVERDRQLVESFLAQVSRRATMTKLREQQRAKDFEKQKQEAFDLNAVAAEYQSLEGDLHRSEKTVQMLVDKIKDINVSEDTGYVKVTVLDVARPGAGPIRPDRKRIMGVALLMGLVLGAGLSLGVEAMDQRLRSVEEIMAVLDVPVLGLVPHIEHKESAQVRGRKVQLEPTSDVAEAYRTLRTAIYFAARDSEAKKLLVTSPAPGDGKTTSASNIAIAMAQAGRRVLLLDADFRRPTQHKIFSITDGIGLSSVMTGQQPLERAIHTTDTENLHVLPCGPVPANPSEILNGQAFIDLLEALEREYDHIVIDSPPIAPVTDARILGALCDETILVLRANKSTRRLTEHARESLGSVGARLLGVIVNDVPRRRDRYGYYYQYSYGYGYGYGYGYYGYGYGREKGKNGKRNARAIVPINGDSNGNGNGNTALHADTTAADSDHA